MFFVFSYIDNSGFAKYILALLIYKTKVMYFTSSYLIMPHHEYSESPQDIQYHKNLLFQDMGLH